jgi:cellulose biosynthesis protein BcsQ
MADEIRILSTVSGKGGVGKTIISSNLARMIAYDRKVLLIDFDFPNQGLTGLFADQVRAACYNARELIFGSDDIDIERVLTIRPNLMFIPAFDPADQDRFDLRIERFSRADLLARINKRLRLLLDNFGFDIVMLDCHGGLDSISFSSFILSDRTIIISEPDKITFNGTLELIDYYEKSWTELFEENNEADSDTLRAARSLYSPHGRQGIRHEKVLFLLNRVSGRFSYDGLTRLYKAQVEGNSAFASHIIGRYVFIPADSILAQSVSEYPLYIELAPESIFCQKLELIHFYAFDARPRVPGRWFTYFIFERKRHRALERQLTSVEEQRTRAVFSFVTLVQFGLLMATVWVGFEASMINSHETTKNQNLSVTHPSLVASWAVFIGLGLLGSSWLNILIAKYYRDISRFELRLFKLGRRRTAAVTLARLVRSVGARGYLLVSSVLFVFIGFMILVAAIAQLLGLHPPW